jgi:hypothetical protein
VLGHRLRVGPGVAGDHRIGGQLVERQVVSTCGEELDEPRAQGRSLRGPELPPPVPSEQHVGCLERSGSLVVGEVGDRLRPRRIGEQPGQACATHRKGHGDERTILTHDISSPAILTPLSGMSYFVP